MLRTHEKLRSRAPDGHDAVRRTDTNYLFTGSANAAERLAAAYTLVQSCRLLGFGARDYLVDVITKLDAGWPMRRIAELVPDRWARDRRLLTPREQT